MPKDEIVSVIEFGLSKVMDHPVEAFYSSAYYTVHYFSTDLLK